LAKDLFTALVKKPLKGRLNVAHRPIAASAGNGRQACDVAQRHLRRALLATFRFCALRRDF
jgi:hypothetical protein